MIRELAKKRRSVSSFADSLSGRKRRSQNGTWGSSTRQRSLRACFKIAWGPAARDLAAAKAARSEHPRSGL